MSESSQSRSRISIAAPEISERAKARVEAVLDSGHLTDGEEVRAFEAAFADYCDADHAVAVANGTAALHAALVACGIDEGDAVVTTPLSFVATANAVRLCGAQPLFADVDPETLTLDPDAVRETVAGRDDVAAILPVHLYGLPAAMDDLATIADDHDAALVGDAAQAHGARYRGDPVGSLGDVGTFSFYPTKNMTTGEGGMVVTDDAVLAERTRRFVNHGRDGHDQHVSLGHNFRMPEAAGAIGRVQLDRLPEFIAARRRNAEVLADAASAGGLRPPADPPDRRHAVHQFTVRTDHRDALAAHLEARGVDSAVYYPRPIHEEPVYDGIDADAPVAERATGRVLSVPVHPGLTESDRQRVADALRTFDP